MAKSTMDAAFKFDKFNGKGNFTLWQIRVRAYLVSQGLHKTILGRDTKPDAMKDEEWEEMDLKALSIIQLCLSDEVMFNVIEVTTAMEMWSKLQGLYMKRSLSTKLYWKRELYGLRMGEGTSISDHLNNFSRICNELVALGVALEEEDKAMILLMSLPGSHNHMVTSLLVGKDTLSLEEVQGELLNNEVRNMSTSSGGGGHHEAFMARSNKQGRKRDIVCFFCKKVGHVKNDCRERQEWLRKKQEDHVERVGVAWDAAETSSDIEGVALTVSSTNSLKEGWILDSGSSVHISSTKSVFSSFVQRKKMGYVKLANGYVCKIAGSGTIHFAGTDGTVHTLEAVYAPRVCRNLISLGALVTDGCEIHVHKGGMSISKCGKNLLHGEKVGGIYKLRGNPVAGGDSGSLRQGGVTGSSFGEAQGLVEASKDLHGSGSRASRCADKYSLKFLSGGGFEVISN